jgi:hypothetical protein
MVKARLIRAISTHANDAGMIPGPTGEAIIVVSADQGPIAAGDMIEIDEFGAAKVDDVWPAGDPAIKHPDLAYDALDGERVVLIFKPYREASQPSAE